MCKSLELREHGISTPIFNSAKLKNISGRGRRKGGAKVNAERKAGGWTVIAGIATYLSQHIKPLISHHLLLNLNHVLLVNYSMNKPNAVIIITCFVTDCQVEREGCTRKAGVGLQDPSHSRALPTERRVRR